MNPYISLADAKLHEVKETKNLNNLPIDFENTFYKDWNDDIDFSQKSRNWFFGSRNRC